MHTNCITHLQTFKKCLTLHKFKIIEKTMKLSPQEKAVLGLAVASVAAIAVFYMISPKHWIELSIVSPLPIFP